MNYDLAGRLTSKDYHTGATPAQGGTVIPGGTLESTDTFSYDAASRLTATTKGRHNISTEHTYAADSMPLTEKLVADGRSYESTRTYDAANRPLTHNFPSGETTHWAYTARNLVASIHYEDKLVAGQNYDAGYRLTSQTLGNGLVRTISYGRQDNLRTADSVATKDDLQMTYSYAADKQITAESIAEDVLADTSFTASYDAGNRITNWNRAGAPVNNAQTWNYDDNGNWISTTKDGTTEARNHDDTDQLTQIAGKAAINDAKGNLTEYEINGKEYEVDYDLDNRIIKVDVDNNDVDYRYDALGRRVIRQEGTTKTALIWWGNSENAEHKHQAGQTVIQNDIMAHPSRLNSVIARAVDGSKFKLEWYHKNYLDHVYAVSDDSGDILEHYRYTAFGEVQIYNASGNQVATTQIDNHILWNTRRRDEVTGFYLYKFRHYSAELGRWLARDPIEESGGVNLYSAMSNQPLNRYDYLGREDYDFTIKGDRKRFLASLTDRERRYVNNNAKTIDDLKLLYEELNDPVRRNEINNPPKSDLNFCDKGYVCGDLQITSNAGAVGTSGTFDIPWFETNLAEAANKVTDGKGNSLGEIELYNNRKQIVRYVIKGGNLSTYIVKIEQYAAGVDQKDIVGNPFSKQDQFTIGSSKYSHAFPGVLLGIGSYYSPSIWDASSDYVTKGGKKGKYEIRVTMKGWDKNGMLRCRKVYKVKPINK